MRTEMRPVFITEDGCEYLDMSDARHHERYRKVAQMVENTMTDVDCSEVTEALLDHAEAFASALTH